MKSIDIRVVMEDDVAPGEAVTLITGSDKRILGAQVLENNGFGHSLPTGPGLVSGNSSSIEEVKHKFAHPDSNWANSGSAN